jgi:hypothetical protein
MTATCDIRFSLQNRYCGLSLAERLTRRGISNDAVTLSGAAVIGGEQVATLEEFAEPKFCDIYEKLTVFLIRNDLQLHADSLVILDIEPPAMAPRHLGDYSGEELERLIRGYRRRIDVAREVLEETGLPGLKLGLYQVIAPTPQGLNTEAFEERMWGYIEAGRQRMYDGLDFVCPVLYQHFEPADGDPPTLHPSDAAATRQAILSSLAVSRSDGTSIPLVPVLSLWFLSGSRKAVSPASVADQLTIVQRAAGIEAILFWSGWETRDEMRTAPEPVEEINIAAFLSDTGVLPWPGCPPLKRMA